ncbi:hypothetical protein [Pusillimonas minor]|uniref:Uncharacterized protein n=1 Tax=Pusillimonas minor TaxID=2697024 RepID=A0A842HTS9_9BURK|nr:hypothetical protein [Pusillimonas minor]MBC2771174.1 hypothetical protein [Pusillimonas minor]
MINMKASVRKRIAVLEALRPRRENRRPKIRFIEGNSLALEIAEVVFPVGSDGWRPATPDERDAYQVALNQVVQKLLDA